MMRRKTCQNLKKKKTVMKKTLMKKKLKKLKKMKKKPKKFFFLLYDLQKLNYFLCLSQVLKNVFFLFKLVRYIF